MLSIFLHELKYYIKNKHEAVYLYSYFVSVLVLVPFVGIFDASKFQSLATIALWVALTGAIALAASGLFQRDQEQGKLEYYQLLPVMLEGVVLAKWLAFFLCVATPLLAVIPLAGLLYDLSIAMMLHHVAGLLAGALGLSILSALVAALTNGLEKAGALLSLIILPLSIPVLIFGSDYSMDSAHFWTANLWFMLGFSAFLLPVMCLAGAYSIRASN